MWDEVIDVLLRVLKSWAASKENELEIKKKMNETDEWYAENKRLCLMVEIDFCEEWQYEYL